MAASADSAVVAVRVTARGSRDSVAGVDDRVLQLRVSAPPVQGAANAACTELLAHELGVRPSAVTLVSGQRSRNKRFSIQGMSPDELANRVAAAAERAAGR